MMSSRGEKQLFSNLPRGGESARGFDACAQQIANESGREYQNCLKNPRFIGTDNSIQMERALQYYYNIG